MARIFRKLAQLLDVDLETTAPSDGDSLTYDSASATWVPEAVSGGGGGGGSDDQTAAEVPFTPAGNIAATDVQAAVEELDDEKAALSHTHSGADITSGTVTDARIASTIARDSEVTAAISALSSVYQAKDTTLDTYAGIDPSANVQSVLGAADYAAIRTLLSLVPGTNVQAYDAQLDTWAGLTPSSFFQTLVDDMDAATARATLGVIASLFQNGGAQELSLEGLAGTPTELQDHLDDTEDAHDASAISVADSAGNFTGTDVEGVLAELQDNIDAGGGGGTAVDDVSLIVHMEVFA